MDAPYWITIMAIIVGPAIGVGLTFLIQGYLEKRQRRLNIFRSLMQTRRFRLSQEHVGALNLVEVEFYGKKKVIEKWNSYWQHLHKKVPKEKSEQDIFFKEQDKKLTFLLQSIGNDLGRRIEQLDIWDGGYLPDGWITDENQIRELRYLALNMLQGKHGLPVVVHQPPTFSKDLYPPKPKEEDVNEFE